MNSKDPIKPPRIVPNCDELSQTLYICIPENNNTTNIDESMNDTPLLTAVTLTYNVSNDIKK